MRIYYIPHREDFYDGFDNDDYDIAILDEYNSGSKHISWLNMWLDGSCMSLPMKGHQMVKSHNIPTVILSNTFPMHWYPNIAEKSPVQIQALEDRLLVVQVPEGEALHRLFDGHWIDATQEEEDGNQ